MSYALLGECCQTNRDILTSNTKFLPIDTAVYKKFFTDMYRYPGHTTELGPPISELEYPEDIKTKKYEPKPHEEYKSCCGKK